MNYSFHIVNGHELHPVLEPLYRAHYSEIQDRLKEAGSPVGPYNPQLTEYFAAMDRGTLLTFIVVESETVVGYCNIWLHKDMHNGEEMASEDAIFVLKSHRNGVGKLLVKFILGHLKSLGVKRVTISAVADLRVAKIWKRMGFRHVAEMMTFTFGDEDVPTPSS